MVQSKDILAVAGSILVTEALHTSLERENVGLVGAANPQGTALGANEVFTLASAFIKSCPSTNAALPFKAFPPLGASSSNYAPETIIILETPSTSDPGSVFVTFINGLEIISIAAGGGGNGTMSSQIPASIAGQTYVVITNSAVNGSLSDSQVLAGPLIIEVTPAAPVLNGTLLKKA